MSRYIDADLLQEYFKADHGGKRSLMIDTQPTADVRENVKGHWNEYKFRTANYCFYQCSECDCIEGTQYKFCPNCGADMRGEA